MIQDFPPNVPKKLIRLYRRRDVRTFHRLAAEIGVNVAYVHRLLTAGIEPTNPETRKKLFLPKLPKPQRQPRSKHARSIDDDLRGWQTLYRKDKDHA